MAKKKKRDIKEIISKIVFWSFIIPIGFLVYRIIVPTNVAGEIIRSRSDYVLMLLQCILGVIAMFLPSMLQKRLKIEIPSNMYFLFIIFLYCAIFLGEVRSYYYRFPYWDTLLHGFSGAMLGALGFSIVNILNKEHIFNMNLSPIFIAFFAFCFAITLGVFWEIYEYSFDGLLGLNMQKFAIEDGTQLVGRLALQDTMKDLIVDCVGAFAMSFIGYVSLKYKKEWLDKLLIRGQW